MKIILTSVDRGLTDAWAEYCGDLPNVIIHHGSILEAPCDAVVSPANSFGFMDGGIDMLYSLHFGWDVQYRLQELIRAKHHGELLVGAAEIVETKDGRIPYLIAAPTMRVPMMLEYSVNPYLAARAVLLLIQHGIFPSGEHAGEPVADHVETVAFPGLGTGVGRVGPHVCAYQVRTAIEEVIGGQAKYPASWQDATYRHRKMFIGFEG